ncbi:MAG TPA: hypothetical protein PK677_16020 [Acidiphilium sp.]|nr:hypothetical protein [Acidiphilium sp.]
MVFLSEECLNVLNGGHFTVVEPGPLYTPIQSFSIRRDEKLRLILETEVAPNATSAAIDHPPGTVRMSTERVLLRSIGGVEAELMGVIPFSLRSNTVGLTENARQELAQVHIAKTNYVGSGPAAYAIDWLENLPTSPFVWPASSRVVTTTQSSRAIALDDGITIARESERFSSSNNVAKLTVEGWTFYICALDREAQDGAIKPGCIVFDGTPDDAFRKKVRTALSFALGLFLVDLGTTQYDKNWHIISTLARSAYTLGRHAFDMGPEQPAPLGPRYQNELNSAQLTRAITALVRGFEDLDLANLSWAYWHACAVTPHIAPAHFGAAIESLQNAYIKSHPGLVAETWAPRKTWKTLRTNMASAIDDAEISDQAKAALKIKLGTFNTVDQRPRLKAVMNRPGFTGG